MSIICNLYKYTKKLVIYMILTGEKCLWSDLWPENYKQIKNMENIIKIIYSMETNCW